MTRWSQEVDSKPPVVELEPRLGKLHSMVWSNVQKVRAVPRSVQKDLGDAFAERLVAWWNDVIDWSPEGQPQWISFSQLYLHFQLTQRHPGLIRVKRGWKDPSAVSLLIPEDVSFRTRCKWFRLYLQATWKTMGFEIGKALTRPRSVTLVCHVGCASVPVKQMAWQLVEEWLQNKSPPIRGHGEQMDRLPVAWWIFFTWNNNHVALILSGLAIGVEGFLFSSLPGEKIQSATASRILGGCFLHVQREPNAFPCSGGILSRCRPHVARLLRPDSAPALRGAWAGRSLCEARDARCEKGSY